MIENIVRSVIIWYNYSNKGRTIMKVLKLIVHILFSILLIITAVWSVIDMRSEYLIAAKSGEGIEFALLPIVVVFWGVIIISEISLWVSTALIIRNVHNKKWFWTAYDIVTASLSLTALYVMVFYRYGNISNQNSDVAIFALISAILLQIVGAMVRAAKSSISENT